MNASTFRSLAALCLIALAATRAEAITFGWVNDNPSSGLFGQFTVPTAIVGPSYAQEWAGSPHYEVGFTWTMTTPDVGLPTWYAPLTISRDQLRPVEAWQMSFNLSPTHQLNALGFYIAEGTLGAFDRHVDSTLTSMTYRWHADGAEHTITAAGHWAEVPDSGSSMALLAFGCVLTFAAHGVRRRQ